MQSLTVGKISATRTVPVRSRPALLFCLKRRQGYWGGSDLSSGLLNSVRFIVDMLLSIGVRAQMQQFDQNTEIDAAIKAFDPTHVIIEGFWVVPSKVAELQKLWPFVTFSVRDHSETPFVANEGIAIEWTRAYLNQGVELMCNSPRAVADMKVVAAAAGAGLDQLVTYAPNYYPIGPLPGHHRAMPRAADDTVRIGCFGAIRPLKNHLAQAVAAIQFAQFLGKKLEFHVNAMRVEGGADPIVKNLVSLFTGMPRATLVSHPWVPHDEFLPIIGGMDYVMQCTLSETFNIVAADAVSQRVPVIGSPEIVWLGSYGLADPNNTASILGNLKNAVRQRNHTPTNNRVLWQWRDLEKYSLQSLKWWSGRFWAP